MDGASSAAALIALWQCSRPTVTYRDGLVATFRDVNADQEEIVALGRSALPDDRSDHRDIGTLTRGVELLFVGINPDAVAARDQRDVDIIGG